MYSVWFYLSGSLEFWLDSPKAFSLHFWALLKVPRRKIAYSVSSNPTNVLTWMAQIDDKKLEKDFHYIWNIVYFFFWLHAGPCEPCLAYLQETLDIYLVPSSLLLRAFNGLAKLGFDSQAISLFKRIVTIFSTTSDIMKIYSDDVFYSILCFTITRAFDTLSTQLSFIMEVTSKDKFLAIFLFRRSKLFQGWVARQCEKTFPSPTSITNGCLIPPPLI